MSGENDLIRIGNFMGDFVKGKQYDSLKKELQIGVLLHRKIDDYFDDIPLVKLDVELLRKYFGRYGGVALDLIYDYYLANNFSKYQTNCLRAFLFKFYADILNNRDELPNQVNLVSNRMIEQDWIFHYERLDGIKLVANMLQKRIGRDLNFNQIDSVIVKHNARFQSNFHIVFKEMIDFSQIELNNLRSAINGFSH